MDFDINYIDKDRLYEDIAEDDILYRYMIDGRSIYQFLLFAEPALRMGNSIKSLVDSSHTSRFTNSAPWQTQVVDKPNFPLRDSLYSFLEAQFSSSGSRQIPFANMGHSSLNFFGELAAGHSPKKVTESECKLKDICDASLDYLVLLIRAETKEQLCINRPLEGSAELAFSHLADIFSVVSRKWWKLISRASGLGEFCSDQAAWSSVASATG